MKLDEETQTKHHLNQIKNVDDHLNILSYRRVQTTLEESNNKIFKKLVLLT